MNERIAPETPGKAARNERRKALATTMNAFSVAIAIAGIIQPLVTKTGLQVWIIVSSGLASVALQVGLHYVLQRLED